MGGGKKPQYDYPAMQHEYVTTDISLRELAQKFDVKSPSSVSAYARRHGWEERRAAFKATEDQAVAEAVAEQRARRIADMETDFFKTVHAAIIKMGLDLKDRWETDPETGERVFVRGHSVDPVGLTKLMDKFLVMTGNVTSREATVGLNVDVGAELPRDVQRELRRLALQQGAGQSPMGESPLPGGRAAKPVNGAVAVTVGD